MSKSPNDSLPTPLHNVNTECFMAIKTGLVEPILLNNNHKLIELSIL